jgi:hypothetical protein
VTFSRARVRARTRRLIASRFPTIGVFDDIAASEHDLRAAFELEALTNDRLRFRIEAIPAGGVATGPTASIAMAAFLHCSDEGARFNDGRLGAWYASTTMETAVEETVHHHERRLRASEAGFPARIQMRALIVDLDRRLLDLRGQAGAHPGLYDPGDYAASQRFAAERRWPFAAPGEDGLVYDSVRRPGGTNVCIFRPAALPLPIVQGDHYDYVWDSAGRLTILMLTDVRR